MEHFISLYTVLLDERLSISLIEDVYTIKVYNMLFKRTYCVLYVMYFGCCKGLDY